MVLKALILNIHIYLTEDQCPVIARLISGSSISTKHTQTNHKWPGEFWHNF